MGVEFLARDTKLDRYVAIKTLPAPFVGERVTFVLNWFEEIENRSAGAERR